MKSKKSYFINQTSTDLQGSFLAGQAGSDGAGLGWRAVGGCCCDMVPLFGDLLTEGQWSLCEGGAPHSHSGLEYIDFVLCYFVSICEDIS